MRRNCVLKSHFQFSECSADRTRPLLRRWRSVPRYIRSKLVCSWANCCRNSSTVPKNRNRPRSTMPMRSAISSASPSVWVDMKMVIPALARSRSMSFTSRMLRRIQTDHRLIEHQHRRIVQQRGRKHQPLLHAVRIAFGHLVDEFGQAEIANFAGNARGGFFAPQAVQIGNELQKLAAGKFFVQIRFVGHIAQAAIGLARFANNIVAANSHLAGRGPRPTSILMVVVFRAVGPQSAQTIREEESNVNFGQPPSPGRSCAKLVEFDHLASIRPLKLMFGVLIPPDRSLQSTCGSSGTGSVGSVGKLSAVDWPSLGPSVFGWCCNGSALARLAHASISFRAFRGHSDKLNLRS